jgi:glycosyltransferase involved in cell wall biosynthesis
MKVLFAEYLTWNTPYRVGSHYYARHMLDLGWEVGWLGGEFHLWNLFSNRAELARKFPLWRAGGVQHPDGPWEYVPFKLIPYRDMGPLGSPVLAWHGDRLTLPSVRRVLVRSGFDRADLLWMSNPQGYPWLIDNPGYRRVIYRVADNQAAREGVPQSVLGIEERIGRRADAVLVVPADSVDRFSAVAPGRTWPLPNGVDIARFSTLQSRPAEYADIRGPIAVYVGTITYYLDVQLLHDIAIVRKDITFVLIGQPVIDVTAIATLPNVRLLGTRNPEQVPPYLQHAQIGLLPFRDTPSTRDVRSLKLYEYMASGIPVIHTSMSSEASTDIPLLLAHDVSSLSDAIDAALDSTPTERAARLAFAEASAWDRRYAVVDSVLATMF